jgi:Zn finger protein HypA/HybF involved in hydrogenase expression
MRKRFVVVTLVLLAMLALGCAAGKPQTVTEETKVKCPKCGVEFTVQEGREAAGK